MFKLSRRRNAREREISDGINAPMVEIFGGSFALLLILFILINVVTNTEIYAMLETEAADEQSYKVSWENQSEGFVVIIFPDRVQILETNESVPKSQLCAPGGPFLRYAERLYGGPEIKQIIFAIVEQAVETMAIARNCLYYSFSGRRLSIGWIIANRDLLNAVKLKDIPVEIKRAVKGAVNKQQQ